MFRKIAVPSSSWSRVFLDCCLALKIEAVRSFRSPGTTQRHMSEGLNLHRHFPQETLKFSDKILCANAVNLKITTSFSPGFIMMLSFLCIIFLINTLNISWVSKVQTIRVFFVHSSVLHVLPNPHHFLLGDQSEQSKPSRSVRLFRYDALVTGNKVQCLCKLCGPEDSRSRAPRVINLGMIWNWLAARSDGFVSR